MSEHDEREDYDDDLNRMPAPAHIVRWPSSIMWVFGLLQLILTQFAAALFILLGLFALLDGETTLDQTWQAMTKPEGLLVIGGWIAATTISLLVVRGSNNLKQFRHYPFVFTAAVLTLLSIPCFYAAVIQLPLGIWIICLLLRRDVRARFDAVARGTKLVD